MQLLKDRIYAKVLEPKPQESGIILQEEDALDRYTAVVLHVGPGVEHIKPGDTIRYLHNLAEYFSDKSGKYVFLRESESVILRCGTDDSHIQILTGAATED